MKRNLNLWFFFFFFWENQAMIWNHRAASVHYFISWYFRYKNNNFMLLILTSRWWLCLYWRWNFKCKHLLCHMRAGSWNKVRQGKARYINRYIYIYKYIDNSSVIFNVHLRLKYFFFLFFHMKIGQSAISPSYSKCYNFF